MIVTQWKGRLKLINGLTQQRTGGQLFIISDLPHERQHKTLKSETVGKFFASLRFEPTSFGPKVEIPTCPTRLFFFIYRKKKHKHPSRNPLRFGYAIMIRNQIHIIIMLRNLIHVICYVTKST